MGGNTFTGSFRVGEFKVALPAHELREVVLYPGSLSSLPDAADCMAGTFTLRGQCVPVLNLTRVLGVPCEADRFMAITQCHGKTLGLGVRDILKVSAVAPPAEFEMGWPKPYRMAAFPSLLS